MVFNATFINISAISWWSVLMVEETGVPGENHRPAAIHRQTSPIRLIDFCCLTPLSVIFQLYHGDQF
jgi:hypothetical protein